MKVSIQDERLFLPLIAMITQETVAQIIARTEIVDVIGDFVKLKRRGSNYLGLCPFHNEKTPSFTVSAAKELYKCFGCGRSGNTISFLMEHEKLSYPEALRWLAKKYNVQVEETALDPEYREQQQQADSLLVLNSFAAKFFQEQLTEEEGNAVGYAYLQHRGFTNQTIEQFLLGYCPEDGNAFTKAALAAKYSEEILVKSGICVNRSHGLTDNYRGRIIFPIQNHFGKIIGFGARIIKTNDKAPKYINTPENELYVKSKVLYGIFQARQSINKLDECLLVEGYTDVISLHQAGVTNVVASGGTSLTADQLRLVKRYTNNLTIVYDGDAAGVKAALRGLDLALEEGLNVQLVLVPDKEDPDSYVQRVGAEAFQQFIREEKKDFILFQLELAMLEAGTDSRKKSEVVNRIAETISKVSKREDFTRQQDYIKNTAQRLGIDEEGLTALVNKFIRSSLEKQLKTTSAGTPDVESIASQDEALQRDSLALLLNNEIQERNIIRCLLQYGLQTLSGEKTIADLFIEKIDDFHFDNELIEKMYNTYRQWYWSGARPTEQSFLYYHDEAMRNMTVSLLEFPYELSEHWQQLIQGKDLPPDEKIKFEILNALNYFMLRKLKQLLDENQRELEKEQNAEVQRQLMEMHVELKNMEREITAQLGAVIVV